ncbi:hypothetical protein FBEOM_13731 [Fusarium beomiforme]|uniref:C2H2-type domain-containing protein n=1 Tax=Fusarium beomiforme TaxID=44412 RepID=A0A9P5A5B7_9HYPO|nr:hypothetical protein FBEOM_13731 [Fusarium beomiforme]
MSMSRPQTLQSLSMGLVLCDFSYYTIAPKMNKHSTRVDTFFPQLFLFCADHDLFDQKEKDCSHFELDISHMAIRQHHIGVSASLQRCAWTFLHCLTLAPGSEQSGFGCKRFGSPSSGHQSGEKKQKHDQKHNFNNSDKDKRGNKGNGQGPGKKKRGFGTERPHVKKFACLFHKYDPGKYESCARYNFTKWDHVLQHLKRIHLLEGEHCPTCRAIFSGEDAETDKNHHIRDDTCQEKTAIETGLLIEDEYNGLTGLGQGSHEEKWLRAWGKLFDGFQPPDTPYLDTLELLLEARCNALQGELPRLLQSFCGTSVEDDRISYMTNAILRLIRNPTSLSQQEKSSNDPSSSSSRLLPSQDDTNVIQILESSHPIQNTIEPVGPAADDDNEGLLHLCDPPAESVHTAFNEPGMGELDQQIPAVSLLEQSPSMETTFYDLDEYADMFINFPGETELLEELEGGGMS